MMTPATQTQRRLWLRQPLAIFTGTSADARGGIVIEGNRIVECVAANAQPAAPVDAVFDASQHVLLPGLINCHHHLYQTLTRAHPAALNKELFDWLTALYPIWAGLDQPALFAATQLGLAELLLSGCTLCADHHYVYGEMLPDALDVQTAAAQSIGLRVTLCRGSMSLGKADGGLPPQHIVQSETQILDDSARVIRRYHDTSPNSFCQVALAPCSPFSVTPELMRESARLARQHGVRLHTHLAETLDEDNFCLQMHGLRPLDYLESVDWLANDVWLAHGIHFNADEIQRLGRAGTGISHCPSSNMVLASGQCPTLDLEQAGAPIGLGVDGSASNDGSNLIQEVRQAMLLQRLRYGAARVSHIDALRWATVGGARVLGRSELGTLAPGQQADIALFRLDQARFSGAGDALAALLLCGAHRADRVMVAGEWRVSDGALLNVDIEQLIADHQQQAHRLISAA